MQLKRLHLTRCLSTKNMLYYLPKQHALQSSDMLIERQIGPNIEERNEMLKTLSVDSTEQLVSQTLPKNIISKLSYEWDALSEQEMLQKLQQIASMNKVNKNYIGQGFYGTYLPTVILRNVFENPAWYTSYTPYQAEISQGRLESLLVYQTMITELTGLEAANASLLDEASAASEAMIMAYNIFDGKKKKFLVDQHIFPQVIEVLKTRSHALGIELVIRDIFAEGTEGDYCGIIAQNPDNLGRVRDFSSIDTQGIPLILGSDLLSLNVVKSPGEMGASISYGSTQRFGAPLGFGGPAAAFFSFKQKYIRKAPGRIIGVSKDVRNNPAFRMTMQTREQHIRREKATSNICTAQCLLANISGFYAIYHGSEGLKNIAQRVHGLTNVLKSALENNGFQFVPGNYFDTLCIVDKRATEIFAFMTSRGINLRLIDNQHLGISLDETTQIKDVVELVQNLSEFNGKKFTKSEKDLLNAFDSNEQLRNSLPSNLQRKTPYMQQQIFKGIHSETQMLRYLRRLELKDLSLATSMIPLGSCTMKLNATTTMMPITWPQFTQIHPYVEEDQALGYKTMLDELSRQLKSITNFKEISYNSTSGSFGELLGLLTIRKYLDNTNQKQRNICLIPVSAHGTNPASCALSGFKIISVKCNEQGGLEIEDLREKAQKHKDNLGCLMITYPSTFGVFEDNIREVVDLVHQYGGQVYMDGANMNAQAGITSPGAIGADVCHLNLHKTFGIPHGGGGPGMGPIAVAEHLVKYLPNKKTGGQIGGTEYGYPLASMISYCYNAMLGSKGIKQVTEHAILNANYMKTQLEKEFKILYVGSQNRVAHEFLIDIRPFKASCGVTEEDVAKRLMDFGIHGPTMSFPVPGALMIEPTESEDKQVFIFRGELDRFIQAMIYIKNEIKRIESGTLDKLNNPLKRAPHTLADICSEKWDRPYTREEAAYPLPWINVRGKFWPTVNRIDNVYGDRNPIVIWQNPELYL